MWGGEMQARSSFAKSDRWPVLGQYCSGFPVSWTKALHITCLLKIFQLEVLGFELESFL